MSFTEGLCLVIGVFLGLLGIAFVRWIVLRRVQRAFAANLIEELNTFNGQIRRLNDRMAQISVSIEKRSASGPARSQSELGETLEEMNRLLRQLNEFFAQESQLQAGDFLTPEEETKFREMKKITEDEIRRANWDEVLDKLREEGKK